MVPSRMPPNVRQVPKQSADAVTSAVPAVASVVPSATSPKCTAATNVTSPAATAARIAHHGFCPGRV